MPGILEWSMPGISAGGAGRAFGGAGVLAAGAAGGEDSVAPAPCAAAEGGGEATSGAAVASAGGRASCCWQAVTVMAKAKTALAVRIPLLIFALLGSSTPP